MKTVKMQGGLGNQLFCLGFAHTVAGLTGEAVALDLAAFAADRYGHGFDLRPLAERLGMQLTRRPLLSSRLVTAVMRRSPVSGYVSDRAPPPADPARLAALVRAGRYFNGYWQHEAWLDTDFRNVARDFLLHQAGPGPTLGVVIHCRTYKEEVRPERRAIPGSNWFGRCLDRLDTEGVDTRDIALISDDPALALAHIGNIGRSIHSVAGGTAWVDMGLLLRARSLILTNSSFSWWGGWCGEAATVLFPTTRTLFHYPAPASRFTVVD